ncbi:MAG: Flp pilus assembly protein CpaB, partial [Planctomycetaceae bacterium]|nr:Flp pilus assembly protein CpaB [Planctomycetaceae bacterium]
MRRLSPAFLTVMMLGIIGLLVVLYVGKKMFATAEAPPGDPLMEVPMALTDLPPGTVITEAHLAQGRSRISKITRDVVRSQRVIIGRVVKNPITAAEPIKSTDLYPPGEKPKPEVAPGMKLVTISTGDRAVLNDSVIRPGDFVDVKFLPGSFPNQEEVGSMILTLVEGVRVVEMNGSSTGSSGSSRRGTSLTLELTPEQANILLLAESNGELQFAYNPTGQGTGGISVDGAERVTLHQILGIEQVPEEEPEDDTFVTEHYSGTGRSEHEFRNGRRI